MHGDCLPGAHSVAFAEPVEDRPPQEPGDGHRCGEDDDGERELELPERKDVAKTKQLLQDASLLIGVDSAYKQGLALVGVFKGRDGGEGNVSNVIYLPQFGVVKEMETGEVAAADFNF